MNVTALETRPGMDAVTVASCCGRLVGIASGLRAAEAIVGGLRSSCLPSTMGGVRGFWPWVPSLDYHGICGATRLEGEHPGRASRRPCTPSPRVAAE